MADFKIGVIVDSFKLDLMDGIKNSKAYSQKGIKQIYEDCVAGAINQRFSYTCNHCVESSVERERSVRLAE